MEILKSLWRILEWKDGCVWKTKELQEVWIPAGLSKVDEGKLAQSMGGDFFGSISTKRMTELGDVICRMKK